MLSAFALISRVVTPASVTIITRTHERPAHRKLPVNHGLENTRHVELIKREAPNDKVGRQELLDNTRHVHEGCQRISRGEDTDFRNACFEPKGADRCSWQSAPLRPHSNKNTRQDTSDRHLENHPQRVDARALRQLNRLGFVLLRLCSSLSGEGRSRPHQRQRRVKVLQLHGSVRRTIGTAAQRLRHRKHSRCRSQDGEGVALRPPSIKHHPHHRAILAKHQQEPHQNA